MRYIATISIFILLAACGDAGEQPESAKLVGAITHNRSDVEQSAYKFNAALVSRDTNALNNLLHDKISYGHSNGWIENKQELKDDLYNGTLIYHKIDQPKLEVILHDNIATVRGDGIFDVDYKEHEHLIFDLHVMQTWVFEKGRWQLLNRQSVSNKK